MAVGLVWRAAPRWLLAALGLGVVVGVGPAATAWATKLLIDDLTAAAGASRGRVVLLVTLVTGLGLVLTIASSAAGVVAQELKRAVDLQASTDLFSALAARHDLACVEAPAQHDRVALAARGAELAPATLVDLVLQGASGVLTIAAYVTALAAIWWPAGLLALGVGVVALGAQIARGRGSAAAVEQYIGLWRRRDYWTRLATGAAPAKEVRLFGLLPHIRDRLVDTLARGTRAQADQVRRTARLQILLALLSGAVVLGATIVVALRTVAGQLSVGSFTLFVAALAGIATTTAALTSMVGQAVEGMRLFRHFATFVTDAEEADTGVDPGPLAEAIRLEDVWFRYGDGPWILRGVDAVLRAGTATALVGLNGAGKSTLVKLLMRGYDPERGRITWDGRDYRDLAPAALRRRLSAVFQDHTAYEVSAGENIGLGDLDHREDVDRIRAAADAAGIRDTLDALPQGLATLLSLEHADGPEEGIMLSGGQWQRLAVARALMRRNPSLLILDEPNSGLDPLAEQDLHRLLRTATAGTTRLLVSHRLDAVRLADRILVLDGGRVIESGTHADLIDADAGYARLFRLQAAGYDT